MKILVINSGSSSIKFRLMESSTGGSLANGLLERVGLEQGRMEYRLGSGDKVSDELPIPNHSIGLSLLLERLQDPVQGAVRSLSEIGAVGHRVVHGGEKFTASILIGPEVIAQLEECSAMAPLHNPPNLLGIRAPWSSSPECPTSPFSTRPSIRPCRR